LLAFVHVHVVGILILIYKSTSRHTWRMTTLLFFGIATANVMKIFRTCFCSFADNFLIVINSVSQLNSRLLHPLSSYCQSTRAAEGYIHVPLAVHSFLLSYILFEVSAHREGLYTYVHVYTYPKQLCPGTSNGFICWVFMPAAPVIVS